MSFKILYQEGTDVAANIYSVAAYVDSFAEQLGLTQLTLDPGGFTSAVAALKMPDFPHRDGLEKASPFKKAAHFFVWFVASKPIIDPLPSDVIPQDLAAVPNHQNSIFAYHMAIDCLHKAELHKNGQVVMLENKIKVSKHFFCDFVETFSSVVPAHHFKAVSLLFEQLAYKANPSAPYPEVI